MNEKSDPAAAPASHRVCWLCAHVRFNAGSPHYSELTPGENFELYCSKATPGGTRLWEFDQISDDLDDFRRKLETAQTCEFFAKRTDHEQ